MGTEAPVEKYTSPYLGKDVKALAKELRDASDKAWLNRIFFAVLDERTVEDGSLMLCRIEDDETVDSLRAWPKHSSLYLRAMDNFKWGELKDSMEFHRKKDGQDVID